MVAETMNGLKLGTTLYSLTNEYHSRQYNLEQLIGKVAELGLGPGLEIVGFSAIRGFPEVSDECADWLKGVIDRNGLVPSCLDINGDVWLRGVDDPMSNEESLVYHERQIAAAAKLGFPVVRYQWGAGTDVVRKLVPLAEKLNVKLGMEIHAPQYVDHPAVLAYREMHAEVDSPYLGFIPDFGASARQVPGGFLRYCRQDLGIDERLIQLALDHWSREGDALERRSEFEQEALGMGAKEVDIRELNIIFGLYSWQEPRKWLDIMDQIVHIHGKFYGLDEDNNVVPYEELLPVLVEGGYDGFMSTEWEGHTFSDDSGIEKVQAHHALCKRILGAL